GGGKPPDLPETKPISSSGFSYLFLAEGGGRRGASDDRDEGGQGHQIGQHVEDEGAGPVHAEPDRVRAADLKLGLQGEEEAEEERAARRAERVPLAEDDG